MQRLCPIGVDGRKVGYECPKHVFFVGVWHSPSEQDTILCVNDLFAQVEKTSQLPQPLTVTEVSNSIQNVLDVRIGEVEVIGQMNSPTLGHHWYFTLSDGDSKIDCAMWASSVSSHKKRAGDWIPTQGDLVIIRGRVGHYAKFGKTQIYVDKIKPAGDEKGTLQQEYEALLKMYREAGWFDEEHKKTLPKYPRRIAVITSASSAALKDVIETARRRMPSVSLVIVNTVMQGDASPDSVKDAIEAVDESAENLGIDAIIVTRGGGGLEELWSFNDKRVIDAAFHCHTPIVVAIGHESDTSIMELVADHRASTPTQAVMVLVPDREELSQMIDHIESRLTTIMTRAIEQRNAFVEGLVQNMTSATAAYLHARALQIAKFSGLLASRRPHALLQSRQKRLLTSETSLSRCTQHAMTQYERRIESLATRLASIGPLEVLRRGFSLTQDSDGKIVRSSKEVKEGEQIRTVLANGTIESTVECVT